MNDKPIEDINSDVQYVKGIGPKRAEILKELGISTVRDLLFYIPRDYLDRTKLKRIDQLQPNEKATVMAEVESYDIKYRRKGGPIYITNVTDRTATLELVWFRSIKYVDGLFEEGDLLYISGKTSKMVYPQMPHPEFEFVSDKSQPIHTKGIVPLYPTTAKLKEINLDSRGFRRIIAAALEKYSASIEDELNEDILREFDLMSLRDAISTIHFPESKEALQRARNRLAFSELFYLELLMAIRKNRYKMAQEGIRFRKPGELVKELGQSLPFELTKAQRNVISEIFKDLSSGYCMRRLIQGDVGSGKTVVAALAAVYAMENGCKAALMVPTEILAEQHYINLRKLFSALELETLLLTSGTAGKDSVREKLEGETSCIVIGTHALIQKKVRINKLGLAVIDEQHRFGVEQRLQLLENNRNTHLLLMTATPIPRTLAMTLYGDYDYSVIDEFPPGKQPVDTIVIEEGGERRVFKEILKTVERDEQVYVVYPLVEMSEKVDLRAATDAYEKLNRGPLSRYGIGLLHGRLTTEEKEQTLNAFNRGAIKILVSTTVIEVGMDNPRAALIVVVGAERYGLSQLHQLRGRVGRRGLKSRCILKITGNLTPEGKQRIDAMVSTNDGFAIAEMDLKIRGPGEFLGTRQHGFPEFKFASISSDIELMKDARKSAFKLIEEDSKLKEPQNQVIREHLKRNYKDFFRFADSG